VEQDNVPGILLTGQHIFQPFTYLYPQPAPAFDLKFDATPVSGPLAVEGNPHWYENVKLTGYTLRES
jgi:hypothetical protein